MGGNDFIFNRTVQPEQIANSSMNSVNDLLVIGTKHFLIFNQTPIQAFPSFRRANQLIFFNIHHLILDLVENSTTFQFENTTAACWDNRNFSHVEINCSNPKKYVFIDGFQVYLSIRLTDV